jgi:predicted AlkP superfamily phosphohydrolase/phosphomutase
MRRTVLIGWDGATFDILRPYCASGSMPHLSRFMERGLQADLLSVIPPLTPPAWTSCITGQSPARHGIFDFARINLDLPVHTPSEVKYRWATSTDIQCETLWSIANREGVRVASLNFPLMLPPPQIDGYLIPGFVPIRHLRRNIVPNGFYEKIVTLPGFEAKDLVFDLDQERRAIQFLGEGDYEEWIRFHIRREERWLDIFRYLVETDDCPLMAILFDGPDKLQHSCWRFMDPMLSESIQSAEQRKIGELCRRYFEKLDEILGEIIRLSGEDASILIVSDHGFGATTEVFYVNAWLASEGLLAWAPGVELDDKCHMVLAETTRNPASMFDWRRTRACSLSSGSNGIYLNVSPDEYVTFRDCLRERLLKWSDPSTGDPVVRRALTREEAFPGIAPRELRDPRAGDAPDLTVELRDGGFVSVLNSADIVRRREQIAGTHRPKGVMFAAGPAFKKSARISPQSILSITPAILYTLGLPIPSDLEGRVPTEAFEESGLLAAPPELGLPSALPSGEATALAAAEASLITERLKALGYIE